MENVIQYVLLVHILLLLQALQVQQYLYVRIVWLIAQLAYHHRIALNVIVLMLYIITNVLLNVLQVYTIINNLLI